MREVRLRLDADDVEVIRDLLLERGLAPLAAKFIVATKPHCSWVKIDGRWALRCPKSVSEGDVVFVQGRDTVVKEVQVGALITSDRRGHIRRPARTKRIGC